MEEIEMERYAELGIAETELHAEPGRKNSGGIE